MNRILSAVLAVTLFLAAAPISVSAADDSTPALGHSMTQTVQDKGNPTSTVTGSIKKDDIIEVVFDRTAFNWTATGNGTYDFTGIRNDWVKINATGTTIPFEVVELRPNYTTGGAVARIRATGAYEGTLSVWLNSGTTPTAVWNKQLVVKYDIARIVRTKSGGTTPACISHSGSTITVNTGDVIRYSFAADNFEWNPADGDKSVASITDTGWIKLSGAKVGDDFKVGYEAAIDGTIRVALTAVRSGTYNSLSVYLQGGGGAATKASAAVKGTVNATASGKINGVASDARLGGTHSGALLNGKAISYGELSNLEVKAGDELLLPLYAGFFTWSGTQPYAQSPVSRTELRSAKVGVTTSSRSGSKAFRDSQPDLYQHNGNVYVRVRFAEEFVSTKDLDFSMILYLTVDGRRHTDSQLEIAGTMVQDVWELYDEDSEYDLSYGGVVEATKYLRNVRLYLGEGVTVHANLSAGRKYAGIASSEPTAADERVMEKYKSIEHVINLNTVNLNSSRNSVSFEIPGSYYVYDSSLAYLGMSTERLSYSSKYYFSTTKLNVDEKEPGYQGGGNGSGSGSSGGGNASSNGNKNPGTGR